jgi:micrococcal nuclease
MPSPLIICVAAIAIDGDTLRCADGSRIRLAGIDAPELPGHCRIGRACAPGDSEASRAALARLVSGEALRCRPVGRSYRRVVAWCEAGRVDLSCAMIEGGWAIGWGRYWGGHRCDYPQRTD